MTYFFIGAVGIILLALSIGFFIGKRDSIAFAREYYSLRFLTQEVSVELFGNRLNLKVDGSDKISAWKIYNEIQTRIGAVDFNPEYDSFIHTNESLYALFQTVRNELSNLPVHKIRRKRGIVEFYHGILNKGIRPYLSKWHIPITHYHAKNKESMKSVIELEKDYPLRVEMLKDIAGLNARMKQVSKELQEIIEAD